MGATKTVGDDHVRWIFNGEAIDPDHPAWKTDPRRDAGQFYAQKNNVSCLLTRIFRTRYNNG